MTKFDDISQTYDNEVQHSIAFVRQDLRLFTEAKAQYTLNLVKKHFGSPQNASMFSISCRIGLTRSDLAGSCINVHDIDISEEETERAKATDPPVMHSKYDDLKIPYPDDTFNSTLAINVFHHAPPANREAEAPIKRAGLRKVDHRYILFFPVSADIFKKAERALKWLPMGARYCIAGEK